MGTSEAGASQDAARSIWREDAGDSLGREASDDASGAAGSLWSELQIQHHHRLALGKLRRFRDRNDLKLNLSCGPNVKPGWLHIDLSPPADLQLDLRESLPFADSSVCMIYSGHCVEHLTLEDARRFMRDSLRVLKPGGLFGVGVPDTESPLTAYVMRDDEFFRSARDRGHPPSCTTRVHYVNYGFGRATSTPTILRR